MKKTSHRFILILSALFLLMPVIVCAENSESSGSDQSIVDVDKAAEQADDAVAELSVEKKKLLATWLHLLDSAEDADESSASVLTYAPNVPADLARVLEFSAVVKEYGARASCGFANGKLPKDKWVNCRDPKAREAAGRS